MNRELYHHGILGQKWGRRNGPPYPLCADDHSASEKKAGWKKSLSSGGDSKKALSHPVKLDRKALNRMQKENEKVESYRAEMIKNGKNPEFYKNASFDEVQRDLEKKQQLRRALIIGAAAVGVGATAYYLYKVNAAEKISKANLNSDISETKRLFLEAKKQAFADMDYVINPSDELHRIAFSEFDMDKVNGPLYVSYDKLDAAIYKGLLGNYDGGGRRNEVLLGTKNKITAPSRKKSEQIIRDLFNDDKDFINDLAVTCANFRYHGTGKPPHYLVETMKQQLSAMSEDERFTTAMWAIVRNDTSAEKMIKSFEKAGYNAIVDFHDIDDGLSQAPLIILNAKKDLVVNGQHFVNSLEQVNAQQYILKHKTELTDKQRKHLGI